VGVGDRAWGAGCQETLSTKSLASTRCTDPLHTLLMLWCVTNSGSSPTRCSFLSGRLPIHVNTLNRPLSAAGGVDIRMTLISEKLQDMGYFTGVAGKWHG
jgi:hypothetical protein